MNGHRGELFHLGLGSRFLISFAYLMICYENFSLKKADFIDRKKLLNYNHGQPFTDLMISFMNKGELVDAIAAKTTVTKKNADAVLTAVLDAIVEAVSGGDRVTLVGFGTFEARDRQAREGRNPQTGAKMTIPATRVPAFSAGKLFKDKVAPAKEEAKPTKGKAKKK
jgi:DNA-binding protein HU-beta